MSRGLITSEESETYDSGLTYCVSSMLVGGTIVTIGEIGVGKLTSPSVTWSTLGGLVSSGCALLGVLEVRV